MEKSVWKRIGSPSFIKFKSIHLLQISPIKKNLMAKSTSETYSPCESCDRDTWHQVLYKHLYSEHDYRIDTIHQMLQCKGCKTLSFQKVIIDYESAYPISDDEWEVPKEIFNFPRVLSGHNKLGDLWDVPKLVREIYTQSLYAIRDESNILAGIGLRATVEAICNDQTIQGRTLDKRIDGLAKTGLISQRDAERLHAIRFLGNDAAHEIRSSTESNLITALRIIEHLLLTLYVLDGEAGGGLETIIRSPEKFLELLNKKLETFRTGEEIPLRKIYGKDIRRLHGYASNHETFLINEIINSNYTKLLIGKVDNYAGWKEKLQHFVVAWCLTMSDQW